MNITQTFRRLGALSLFTAALAPGLMAHAEQKEAAPVAAWLYSTMPSLSAHRPEMALDSDTSTYFQSVYGMGDGDDFLVLLSSPIPVDALNITTGNPDSDDLLTNGVVETSADGVHYTTAAAFNANGVAEASLNGKPVEAIRIRLNPGQGLSKLIIREISIQSKVPISHVALGPGRGFYDVSAAPDLAGWAQKAEAQMEQFWPDTAALLYTDRFLVPNMVNVIYKTGPDVTGVAATGGGVMTVNTAWCHAHPEDTGLTVHETAHVIQAFSSYNPVWLVEGIADYIRWVKFEPEHFHPRINPQKSTYHDSYQTTATFLGWCELHYDSGLVTKLSRAVRFGTYKNEMFKQYCGKDVDTLWAEFVAAYQADPQNIITRPMAAADRPRVLPAVKAGSSVSVDLSAAFNGTGLFTEGQTLPGNGGVDGEGNGFAAQLLSSPLTWKDVQFTLGPTAKLDLVSCRGVVLPVAGGSYSSLWLLGTAVEGSQMAQTFVVTYTDGSTDTLTQNFSDWYQPQSFPGESRAIKMPYRMTASGLKDARTFYVYSYGFPLNAAKTVKSVTLPSNENVKLFAVTLAN